MRVAATQYTLKDRAFEIYFSGCTLHCKGCFNKELWDFDYGEFLTPEKIDDICSKIQEAETLIREIRFFGGEPLDQDEKEFEIFVAFLKEKFPILKVVLFTGYDVDKITVKCSRAFELFDAIKYGAYREDLKVDGEFASSNQKWWIKVEKQ